MLIAYVLVLLEKHFWLLFRIFCWKFDTNSLSLVNKRVFNEKLGSACYGKDKIVVRAANMVYLLETDFSTIEVLSGSQIKSNINVHI